MEIDASSATNMQNMPKLAAATHFSIATIILLFLSINKPNDCYTIPTRPASSFLHDEPSSSAAFSGVILFRNTPYPLSRPDQ